MDESRSLSSGRTSPGAFSSNHGDDFRTVLEEIAKVKDPGVCISRPEWGNWPRSGELVGRNYSIAWRTVDAKFWGVPQRRKRIYLVADFSGKRAGKIQFECDRLFGDSQEGAGQGKGTPETAGGCLAETGGAVCLNDQGGNRMDVTEGYAGTLRSQTHGHPPVIAAEAGTMTFHLTQDPIVSVDSTPCLTQGNSDGGQATIGVLTPVAFGLVSKASNAWKSSNPHSGCYQTDTARTLDTSGGDATRNQGGNLILSPATVFENHSQDTRFRPTGDTAQTVVAKYGTGGSNQPLVVQPFTIGRDYKTVETEAAQTLTRSDVPGMVAQPYSIGNGQTHVLGLDEAARTLNCMHDAQAVIIPTDLDYIVRRLMPLECSRLQGYPDWWMDNLGTPEPTESEIDWWSEVFETHRKAVKPDVKPRTRNQIRKWLQDPHNDSAEYRMWGNSLAIPNAYHVLAGIAEEIQAEPLYIASWSGGKDSTASIILAHEHGEPLDLIIFSEVMFDKETSGELPEHIDFVKNKAIPLFESWGYEVKVLHADINYMDIFMREPTRGKRVGLGMKTGFPMSGRCQINRSVKVEPIQKFLKSLGTQAVTQYIGIAIDEPKRLARLEGTNRISLLERYGCTEQMARELCERYDLLSPTYEFSPRGGCWFCPNARNRELRRLRDNHPDLWQRLLELESIPNLIGYIWNTLDKRSVRQIEEMFQQEDLQISIFDLLKQEE